LVGHDRSVVTGRSWLVGGGRRGGGAADGLATVPGSGAACYAPRRAAIPQPRRPATTDRA